MDDRSNQTWAPWTTWLRGELDALTNGGFLVLTAREPLWPASKRGFLGSRKRAAADTQAFVQFLLLEDHLYVECSGADVFGGPLHLSAESQQRLARLGWRPPVKTDHTDNYLRWFSPEDSTVGGHAAGLATETLRDVFQVASSDSIDIKRGP